MNKILHSKILGEGKPLIILHGLFGMLDNWQALAKEFACFFETHIVDLRNHGRSFHATQHNYEVMTEDLLSYLNAYNLDEVSLIGHSMGGCIGLRSLIDGLPIKKVIFSGPMWGIYVEPKMRIPATIIARIGPFLGFGEKFVPSGSEDYYVLTEPFESNVLTNDQDQYEILKHQLQTHPDLGLGGPSLQWFNRALIETKKLVVDAPAKQDCLCLIGTEEAIVSVPAIKEVMAKWPNGKLVEVPNAHHEVLMEGRAQLELVWSEIDTHLA